MDAEFRSIWEMSCRKGFLAMRDEAEYLWGSDPEILATFKGRMTALRGDHHRAMTVYLDYPLLWPAATRFYQADSLSFWRKRKNMGGLRAHVDEASVNEFEKML